MDFKDYYATLGVDRGASADEIKRAYRKLARQYHPDVSKEANAEARFKDVAEAHEALSTPERRATYDEMSRRRERGQPFQAPFGSQGFDPGAAGADPAAHFSEFFESLFGQRAGRGRPGGGPMPTQGNDHRAQVSINLLDSWHGARRTVSLRVAGPDAQGRTVAQDRQLEIVIPKGIRQGQQLRLAGQGGAGRGGGPAGDLYLEVQWEPHPQFRVDGRDVTVDLALAPWEAALGAVVTVPTPAGDVQLTIAAGASAGRRLRLKGRGLPGNPAGDLYAVVSLALPLADTQAAKDAYAALATACAGFDPRALAAAAPAAPTA